MSDARQLRTAILEFMRRPNYRPASADELQSLLRIDRSHHHPFNRALRALIDEDEVVRVDRHRYAITGWKPPAHRDGRGDGGRQEPGRDGGRAAGGGGREARGGGRETRGGGHEARGRGREVRGGRGTAAARGASTAGQAAPSAAPVPVETGPMRAGSIVVGTIQVHPKGFAFVTPDRGGVDLFIPPPDVGNVHDGDRVEVRVVRMQTGGRTQGEVLRVVEKSRRRIVGVYKGGPGGGTVEAYDRRYEAGIAIPPEGVGGAVNGLVVGVEIDQSGEEGRPAWGRIVEVIGPAESPETDLKAIIRKFGLRQEFPPDVMQQASQAPDRVPQEDLRGREDFRDLPIVTIDGETAMDFDDAVLVRRLGDAYELHVHIADVAHYVRPATPLDAEALERATSVYFPGTSLPMLPHRLSNGICSLNPRVDRLVLSCVMTIDRQGTVTQYRLVEGVIRSAARMTYTNVAKILVDRDPAVMAQYRDLVPNFLLMQELHGVLNAARRRRGSIDFDLPEPEVILAATGEMTGIMALERNIAHRLIEEFMLAANETVARHLFRARIPAMYRVHERPDPRRLEDFDAVAHAFGYSLPRPFTAIEPRSFQALLERAQGRPEERFLSRLMLRSMKQARYSEKRDIHFGLASSCYTHFTSPIRRYPDLVVHRLVKRLLRGGGALPARERGDLEAFMPEAAARSSVRERTADAAENELIQRKKMVFMAQKIGEEFDGFICGVEAFGIIVELRDLFVDGLVAVESLPGDRFRFIERQRIMKGERHGQVLALGDPVRVRLSRVNSARMEIEFALLDHRPGPRPAGIVAAVREAADTRAGRRDGARRKRRADDRKGAEARGAAPRGRSQAPAGEPVRHGRRGRRRGGGGATGAGSVRSGRGRRRGR